MRARLTSLEAPADIREWIAANAREWILSYAILAPHSHNLQSWLVDLRQPDEITLYCDLGRLFRKPTPIRDKS